MKRETDFMENIERYHFDFGECSAFNGYAQVDTSQDAPYFGIWTNPMNLTTVSYMEGDIYRETAESVAEYVEFIRQLKSEYEAMGTKISGIDPMLNSDISNRLIEIGLGDLIH